MVEILELLELLLVQYEDGRYLNDAILFLIIILVISLAASIVYSVYKVLAANGKDLWIALIISYAIVALSVHFGPRDSLSLAQAAALITIGTGTVFLVITGKMKDSVRFFTRRTRERIGDVDDE